MLPNYDAKAVAEVMGLAFVLLPKEARRAREGSTSPFIDIGDAVLRIVGRSGHAKGRRASPSPVFIEKAVESGLPRQALEHVAEAIAGGDKAKASALERGIVPRTTLERRESKLSRQESERTERVARLFVQAPSPRQRGRGARVHDGTAPRARRTEPLRGVQDGSRRAPRRADSERARIRPGYLIRLPRCHSRGTKGPTGNPEQPSACGRRLWIPDRSLRDRRE